MKKTLLSLSLLIGFGFVQAQNLISEDFAIAAPQEVFPPTGWTVLKRSLPTGSDKWGVGAIGSFYSQDNANPSAYAGIGFQAAAMGGTISDWLFSPSISLQNGDVVSFYTRTGNNSTGGGNKQYPDRLQMLIGVGSNPVAPVGATGLGGYAVAVDVNQTYNPTGYPNTWTKYSYTVTGIPTETPCKVAFRYFVENTSNRADYIGIDTFSVDRTLGTEDFFMSNFSIAPNPANEFFNLTAKNGMSIENVKVFDINGRMVNEMTISDLSEVQVNISDLNTGVYFVKVQSESGIGTAKIVKR